MTAFQSIDTLENSQRTHHLSTLDKPNQRADITSKTPNCEPNDVKIDYINLLKQKYFLLYPIFRLLHPVLVSSKSSEEVDSNILQSISSIETMFPETSCETIVASCHAFFALPDGEKAEVIKAIEEKLLTAFPKIIFNVLINSVISMFAFFSSKVRDVSFDLNATATANQDRILVEKWSLFCQDTGSLPTVLDLAQLIPAMDTESNVTMFVDDIPILLQMRDGVSEKCPVTVRCSTSQLLRSFVTPASHHHELSDDPLSSLKTQMSSLAFADTPSITTSLVKVFTHRSPSQHFRTLKDYVFDFPVHHLRYLMLAALENDLLERKYYENKFHELLSEPANPISLLMPLVPLKLDTSREVIQKNRSLGDSSHRRSRSPSRSIQNQTWTRTRHSPPRTQSPLSRVRHHRSRSRSRSPPRWHTRGRSRSSSRSRSPSRSNSRSYSPLGSRSRSRSRM